MKSNTYISLIISTIILWGCGGNTQEIDTEGKTPEQIAEIVKENTISQLAMSFDNVVQLKYSDYVLFPLQTVVKEKEGSLLSQTKRLLKGKYEGNQYMQMWNILFYNPQTQQSHLLDEKNEFEILMYDTEIDSLNAIFYNIIDDKATNDSLLDDRDLNSLYISDRAGKNFRQISPLNTDLGFYYKNPKSNELIFNAVADNLPTWYALELSKPDSVRKMFADDFSKKLQQSVKERVTLIKPRKVADKKEDKEPIGKLYFGYPDTLVQSNFLMIPILSHFRANEDKLRSYEYDYQGTTQDNWNFIFYNFKDKTYRLLTNEEMEIASYSTQRITNAYSGELTEPQANDYFFYTIRKDSFNKDSLLNHEDPEYLYISDNQGKNFRQISPENASVQTWQRAEKTSKILMYVWEDIDNNKKLDEKDAYFWYEVDLQKPASLRKVFDSQYIKKLKTFFIERKSIQKLLHSKEE